ncbi:hypothetical protein [Sphingopyxis kveilinensis]|uniref:hypothetical protein n=1 Tax=Sphingopyxis kveilinensis TaxID=3114367 RepID=UPI0030CF266B
MVQVAAALLFALAAGLGVTVILAMLRNNENAILSALLGEGAFPDAASTRAGPPPRRMTLRRADGRRPVLRAAGPSLQAQLVVSRAA